MIEQMKNKNEYREDGNLYVKEIKSCTCQKKKGEYYIVSCKIHQRGDHVYRFCNTEKWISKVGSERKLWLAADAEKTVRREVDLFNEQVKHFQGEKCRKIRMDDAGLSVYYESFAGGKLNCLIKYFSLRANDTIAELYIKTSIEEILHHLQCSLDYYYGIPDCESKELLQNPTKENIMKHPFIVAAQNVGDVETEKKIKVFYRLADIDDCNQLANILGLRILPTLPKEYDKNYYIDADTVSGKAYALLTRSGFEILHRPYFAMKGSTHTKITLNPHTKTGVDAAKTDTESLSFEEFLDIYDSFEHSSK